MTSVFQDQIIQRYENWTILSFKNMSFKRRKKCSMMNLEGEMILKVVTICQMIVLSCSIDNLYNFYFAFMYLNKIQTNLISKKCIDIKRKFNFKLK